VAGEHVALHPRQPGQHRVPALAGVDDLWRSVSQLHGQQRLQLLGVRFARLHARAEGDGVAEGDDDRRVGDGRPEGG